LPPGHHEVRVVAPSGATGRGGPVLQLWKSSDVPEPRDVDSGVRVPRRGAVVQVGGHDGSCLSDLEEQPVS
jgi:hypothetical protein